MVLIKLGLDRIETPHTGGIEMLQYPVVHRVQILDIERREGQRTMELLWKKTFPRVISHEHHTFACDSLAHG